MNWSVESVSGCCGGMRPGLETGLADPESSPALESLVYGAHNAGRRLIIEGEKIRPDVVVGLRAKVGPTVAALFLSEPSAAAIRENLEQKSRHFLLLTEARQQAVVTVDDGYGHWIGEEARRFGLPVLEPRPWETSVQRALEMIAQASPAPASA